MTDKFNREGGYFSPPNYLRVDTGDSHAKNPNGGVQIGVDGEGIPNLLEQDESVYNDYVFSDNIKANRQFLKKYNIPEKYAGKMYSEIADSFVDEIEDRPLDPISNNGLNKMLTRLASAQDAQKLEREQKEIKDELSKLSPEELDELESALSQPGSEGELPPEIGGRNSYKLGGSFNINPNPYRKLNMEFTPFVPDVSTPQTEETPQMLPTWPRYVGGVTAGLAGLYNALQKPDTYVAKPYVPALASGRLNLVNPVFKPVDAEMPVQEVLSASAGTARALQNAGNSPSVPAALVALDYNTGKNIGTAKTQASEVNARRLNEVIEQRNNNARQLADFDYTVNKANADAINNAKLHNIQNALQLQRLNYSAEGEKAAAIQSNLDAISQLLAGIGKENFAMNQINSGAYDYVVMPDGTYKYMPKTTTKK